MFPSPHTRRRVILDKCTFTNNGGAAYGGAVELWSVPYASITDCVFSGNNVRFLIVAIRA